jgi:hypothetical protein
MNNHEKLVKTIHPEAILTGIRGLKLYIIECDNHMGWRKGLGYGTTPTKAWYSAYLNLWAKNKFNK